LALSGIVTYGLAKVVKAFVQRGRPGALLDHVALRGTYAGGLGFVSGHAADAVALAAAASPYLDRRGRVVVWGLAAVVGAARLYVGAHLPLDVSGGAGLGYAGAAAVRLVFGAPAPLRTTIRGRAEGDRPSGR
jgi:undecaprenyl-diphosphatase